MTSHPEIAGARCECPACRIERLEAELAESRRVNASLNKEHRDLAEKLSEAHNVAQALEDSAQEVRVKLAEANAKIEAVRVIHRAHSVLTAECVSCRGFFPCRTIRALESATPQGSLAGSPIQAKDDQC